MKIDFFDLKKVNLPYKNELTSAINKVIESGWFILGENVTKFEYEFADYCKVKHCVAVGNGLDALKIILQSYIELGKLEKGDFVIVPSNTFIASALAVTMAGLRPLFVEPDFNSFNLDLDRIRTHISSAKAVIAVHLFGQPARLELHEINSDILLIEDAAQGHGAELKGVKAGNIGNAAGFSFYPTKNLGAFGDGGAITTNDSQLAEVASALRNYGSVSKYEHKFTGMNSRLDEMQAAILSIKLKYLDEQNLLRSAIAGYYDQNITNEKIIKPAITEDALHVYHQYVIKCDKRDDLKQFLLSKGINSMIHYPKAVTEYLPFTRYSNQLEDNAKSLHTKILSLPISPALTDSEIEYIVKSINAFNIQ